MSDLLDARGAIGGVFKGATTKLTIGDGGGGGAQRAGLTQSVGINYSRGVSCIWELGTEDTYYVIGRTEGSVQTNRIVTKSVEGDLLDALRDACSAKDKTLSMSSTGEDCEEGSDFSLVASGPVVTGTSFNTNSGQFLINSGTSIMISGLERAA